ncbi:MAG: hypothetical protein RLZZ272_1593 [Actinomycetota bacterium]
MTRVLGLDLGGTNVKTALVEVPASGATAGAEVVATAMHPTHAERGAAAVVDRLAELALVTIEEHGPVAAMGLGIPGLFDRRAGTAVLIPNLPGPWEGRALRDPIERAIGVPVHLINDARAFTLAEAVLGAGRGCSTMIGVTLGTGVGGGVFIDGEVRLGAFGTAGEISHQIVEPDGPVCGCGNRGCAEALTRADVLAAAAGRASAEEVYAAAAQGDRRCEEAIARAADYLGIAIANAVVLIGPERVVIGGGIAASGEAVIGPIRAALARRSVIVPPGAVEVVAAELGTLAGAIGAALAAVTELPGPEPRSGA